MRRPARTDPRVDLVLAAMRQGLSAIKVDRSALLASHRAYEAVLAMLPSAAMAVPGKVGLC